MFVLSYISSGVFFNYRAFAWTNAEIGDMTINYFSLNHGTTERIIFVYSAWIILILAVLVEFNNKLIKMCLILILCFFNPYCCSFIYKINRVYQRAYDIIINPFNLTIFTYLFFKKINNKYIYYGVSSIAIVFLLISTDLTKPVYYNVEQFTPGENYDKVHKMEYAEYEMIVHINEDYLYRGIERPLIVTPNILTYSSIPDGRYLYGREFVYLDAPGSSLNKIYDNFYPYSYFNSGRGPSTGDFDNIKNYIEDAGVDYLVVDSNLLTYNSETDEYYTMLYLAETVTYQEYVSHPYFLFYTGK